jgi:hypothetical protein
MRISRANRRTFLQASAAGLVGTQFASSASAAPVYSMAGRGRAAKSTILFFLCGGASHVDTWDMKPDAPDSYRGPFRPVATSAPGVSLCEHLPLLGQQAHHLAVIQGLTDGGKATGDHHAGYYYNLTGQSPDVTFRTQGNDRRPYRDDWPFMGSVVGSRRPPHETLPQLITLPHKPSAPPYTRPGQFAARLGLEHDPFYLQTDPQNALQFLAPSLSLEASGMSPDRLASRKELLSAFNGARRQLDQNIPVRDLSQQQGKAFGLLASKATGDAFDVSREPSSVRERYGETVNGLSLLMARRLVEAEVPFITVFWKENESLKARCKSAGGWDTHGNNFGCLKDCLLPEFDRAFSALIEDLHQRSLLDDTLVMLSSEMGRKPKIGDPRSGGFSGAGRDHWTACMSTLMAGGGIQGGQVIGETDKHAEYPENRPISPADVAKTVYYSMGVTDLTATDEQGRPYHLLEAGEPLSELF